MARKIVSKRSVDWKLSVKTGLASDELLKLGRPYRVTVGSADAFVSLAELRELREAIEQATAEKGESVADTVISTAGQLRGATAWAPSVCPVKVWVYLPGHRGPVEAYIAGYALKNTGGEGNSLNLYVRPVPDDEPAAPVPVAVPDEPDRGKAGKITERVPNAGEQ